MSGPQPVPDAPPEKWIGRSRAFWGMMAPVLALFLSQVGASEAVFGHFEQVATGLLGVAGAGSWLYHHLAPDFARITARIF